MRRPARPRKPAVGDSSAPVTTLVVLAVAAVAVFAGVLLLQTVTEPDTGSDEEARVAVTTTLPAPVSTTPFTLDTTSTSTTTTTTTIPTASKGDATIVVANASGINRTATAMSDALAADGYTVTPVANTTGPQLERSIIHYVEGDAAAQGVARLLGEQIPTAQVLPLPNPAPLDRPLGAATVVFLLGRDAAGRSLAELQNG